MRLIEKKSGSGVRWVLVMTEAERAAADSRSLDCAGSFAIANDPASLGMTNQGKMLATDRSESLGMTICSDSLWITNPGGTLGNTSLGGTLGMTNYGGTLGATDLRETNELRSSGNLA